MNVVSLWREFFHESPSPDDAAEMDAFREEPEARLRATFARTARYRPANPWAYARAMLLNETAIPDDATPTRRKSVLCDRCGKPYDADWLVLEGRYAFCKPCVEFVRGWNDAERERGPASSEEPTEFTESAQIVRRHFGLVAR
jgi:hypothetical protein